MKGEIKFSVIIPCFNDFKRIGRSVESCIVQTYAPFEIIIIDDGSEVETINVINELVTEYSTRNVKSIFLKKNAGVSVARNAGMNSASGDFICFLDSDDVWHSDKLMTVKNFINRAGDNIALAHDFTYNQHDLKMKVDRTPSIKKITFQKILFKNHITTPSLVLPRNLNLLFREDMRYAEDHEFILRLSKKTQIYFLHAKLVFINRALGSKGGLSGDTWKMRLGELRMFFVLCKSDWRFYFLLPFLVVYSLIKHLRKVMLHKLRIH